MRMTSPWRSGCAPSMRRPLTLTPLVEPRSRTIQAPPVGRTSAWRRETFSSPTTTSQSLERPSTAPPRPSIDRAALVAQLRAAAARLVASASGSAMRLAVE